jgi:hypothetical protein
LIDEMRFETSAPGNHSAKNLRRRVAAKERI